ncbi:MAG TPA: hypothetical protein VF824_00255 [Thermoanaerobaculia bacterium]|jgi:hypothetical protein
MAGNPREHVKDKGFWDGGTPGHAENGQTAGRSSGFPGVRKPKRAGVKTDLDYPAETGKKA